MKKDLKKCLEKDHYSLTNQSHVRSQKCPERSVKQFLVGFKHYIFLIKQKFLLEICLDCVNTVVADFPPIFFAIARIPRL